MYTTWCYLNFLFSFFFYLSLLISFSALTSAAPKISTDSGVLVYQVQHMLGEAGSLDDASDLDGAFFFYKAARCV